MGVLIAAAGFSGFAVNAAVMLWNLAPSARLLGLYTFGVRREYAPPVASE